MNNSNIYLFIIIWLLIHFTWYYITLPDSVIFTMNKKKPPISKALLSYLSFFGPFVILLIIFQENRIKSINHLIPIICKLQSMNIK